MKIKSVLIIIVLLPLLLSGSEFEKFMLQQDREESGFYIFNRVMKKMGDFSYVNNIQTISDVTKHFEQGNITFQSEVLAVFPDKIQLKFEDKEFIINKDKGWLKYSQGYYENLKDRMIVILRSNLEKNLVNLIKYNSNFEFIFQEIVIIDNNEYEIIEIRNKSKSISDFLLYINVDTYLPYKMIYAEPGQNLANSSLNFEKIFLDYILVNNRYYPSHTITRTGNAEFISENKIISIQFNVEVDPELFQ